MLLEVGSIIEGKVTGITKFGAFVSLPNGKSGLVHISEVANTYVNNVSDFLSEGQTVKVKVISISQDGKINLSVKQAVEAPPRRPVQTPAKPPVNRQKPKPPVTESYDAYYPQRSDDASFEDKLKQFMQESGSKMSGNRLYEKQKRVQRRRKN